MREASSLNSIQRPPHCIVAVQCKAQQEDAACGRDFVVRTCCHIGRCGCRRQQWQQCILRCGLIRSSRAVRVEVFANSGAPRPYAVIIACSHHGRNLEASFPDASTNLLWAYILCLLSLSRSTGRLGIPQKSSIKARRLQKSIIRDPLAERLCSVLLRVLLGIYLLYREFLRLHDVVTASCVLFQSVRDRHLSALEGCRIPAAAIGRWQRLGVELSDQQCY